MVSGPPAYSEDYQGDEHDYLVDAHHRSGGEGCEPQLARVLLHVRHLVYARLLHGRLNEVGVGRAAVGDVGLSLQTGVERVAGVDELLHLLELVGYLRRLRLVEVVGVRAYAVGDVGQEVQKAPAAPAVRHVRVSRRVPPAEHDRDSERAEQLHDVQRLVLHHHLVGHARHHDNGEDCGQCHAHL